ncbi:beta strand repeat-containing protein [Chryseobacterium shigense]|uniref:Putative repeat protein (TIGR01451 family) n=1 Tax=Chryseobacterium shigense TaxID=297244 RepID=A0A841N316_9FLAO|nr:hypothetical protein [Chryseobacterium shigense]MBB6369121.1 putative repeat protein (TIGR01451 family) [Chryseobacterium shigense]
MSVLINAQNPGGVTNVQLWYKANAGITPVGSNVQTWSNSAPSSTYTLAQQSATAATTLPAYNTSQINFNPSVRFDGVDDRLVTTTTVPQTVTTAAAAPYTTSQYVVYRNIGTNARPLYNHSNGGGSAWNVGAITNGAMYITNRYVSTSTPAVNEIRLQELDGSTSAATSYLNGASVSSVLNNGIGNAGAQSFWIGGESGLTNVNADIAEVVIYNINQTAANRTHIESYLCLKYGMTKSGNYTTPGTASTYWSSATNTGFNNNITGIGRDDNSALYQKQSMSINSGQQVLIGLTGMANTNASNTGTLTDQQYLVVGDNGSAKAPSVPINGITGVNYRFGAVWKVQNTGSVGTVRVMWPQGLSNIKLIQNNLDPTFSVGNTFVDMSANTQTINGVIYNYADVTLADGQYFTLAAFVQAPGGVISSLQIWNRADFGTNTTAEGGTVTSWNNSALPGGQLQALSGFTSHTASSTYLNQGGNFNPTVRMIQGAGLGMLNAFSSTATTLGTAGSFYNVSKAGAGGTVTTGYNVQMNVSNATLSTVGSPEAEIGSYINSSTSAGIFRWSQSVNVSNLFTPSTYNILGWAYTTSLSSGTFPYKINGKSVTASYAPSAFTGRNFHLNTDTDGGLERGGNDYQEVIGYERQVTPAEQSRIESYLAVKYGITIDQTTATNYVATDGTTIWNATTNSAYNQNIAGIGRDDNTALNQKQSQSINSNTSQVIIGIGGTLANTNALNTNSFPTDRQYLMWGDNGLARSLSVIITGISGINLRFAAIWKAQNTTSVGTVRVLWPQGITNMKLLQSSDAIFDSSDTVTNMTSTQVVNGITYNYADVTLANGQYFTFAGFINAPAGVAAGLGYWYDAGVTATLTNWSDRVNGFTISKNGTGAIVLSNGDTNSNYNPFYTFSATDFAHFTGVINPVALGRLHTTFAVGAKSGDINAFYSHIFRFGNDPTSGTIHRYGLGINTSNNYSSLHYINSGGTIDRQNTNFSAILNKMTLIGGQVSSVVSGNNKQVGYNGSFSTFSDDITADVYANMQIGGSIYGFAGRIPEVVYYNASLSTQDRDKVDSYFAIKYGITLIQPQNYLNSDATIVWNSSTNTAFNNNIFGVARDVIGNLDQKVSHSINDNSILTASTVNDFTSPNSTVSRTSLADKGFMMFGDNNIHTGTTVVNPVNCPALADGLERINKTWLVQETGTVGAAYFEVDLSSYNINSEISLYFADDSGFTTNTGISPAVSVSGGKAVFYYNFKNGQYFTVVGKVGPIACQTCTGGKQTLQNAQAWFNGGTTGMNTNTLSNVPLTGTAPASGALSADISATYPSGVEWIPTLFPRMFGKWTQLSRYDNLSGAAGKVSYTVNLKDVSGSKAAKASFQIAGITKLAGQTAVVKVIGYCGANQVIPKMNYAYNSTPALNSILRRYTIDSATGTATGTQPYLDYLDYATVNVDFEKPVEKIVIEWTINREQVFSKVDFLYIGDMSFVCANPIEPTPDNVSIIASYIESQLPTCEDATLKLNIKNNNCTSKTIDINNTLPGGLQYVAASYVGLGTEAPTYAGQNFLLNDLTVPSGDSYIYIKVRPSGAGTYATHFNYTVDGGINNPNPYRSDDDSGTAGYQDTSITYTASPVIAKPTVTKSVNRCFGTSSTELEYTVNITNNDTNPITSVEFMDNLDAAQTYITGSLVQTNFTANGTATFNGGLVYISGMSIAPGQTAVVKFKVNTNTSASMAYTDVDGSKFFYNQASVSVDPQSQCGAANSVASNLLKVLACTYCTKDPNTSPADTFTKIGITIQTKQSGWPENLPNGAVALESKTKGFVITRTQSSLIVNPVEGMLIYDTTDKCMKLYNGTSWNCVVRSCNE